MVVSVLHLCPLELLKINTMRTRYCDSLVPPGVYPGVMTKAKWLSSREKECWDSFVEICPNEAKKSDKVPNWARKSLGLGTSLGRLPQAFPLPLQHAMDELLLQKLQFGMEISPAGIADLIGSLLVEYNNQVKEVNAEIEKMNGDPLEEDSENPRPLKLATCTLTKGNLEKLAAKFGRKFCWGIYKNERPGKHLEFNDPQLVAIRKYISASVRSGKVHERLVANWDQVWTLTYEPLKRVAWKDQSHLGEKSEAKRLPRKADFMQALRCKAGLQQTFLEIHHQIVGVSFNIIHFLGCVQTYVWTYIHVSLMAVTKHQPPFMPLRDPVVDRASYYGPQAAFTDQYSQISSVDRWRIPRSSTTLTWVDGHVSRIFTTIGDGLCSGDQLKEMQERFQNALHIETSGNASHMWSAQTTMSFLQFLSVEPWTSYRNFDFW